MVPYQGPQDYQRIILMIGMLFKILGLFLSHAQSKNDTATAKALEGIKADVAANAERASVTRSKLGHPVAWIPSFLMESAVAVYIAVQLMDGVFDLAGEVAPVTGETAAVVAAVVGGMALKRFA